MKKLACLLLLAACELKPAPKQQPASAAPAAPPAPSPPPATKPVEPPPRPPPARPDTAAIKTGVEITPACLQVGVKIAQVYIDSAKDPAQRAVYERERANMTRKTGEACTKQAWSDAARACYLATKTPAEIKACENKFKAPPTRDTPAPHTAPTPTRPAPHAERLPTRPPRPARR